VKRKKKKKKRIVYIDEKEEFDETEEVIDFLFLSAITSFMVLCFF